MRTKQHPPEIFHSFRKSLEFLAAEAERHRLHGVARVIRKCACDIMGLSSGAKRHAGKTGE
jgi:hypothetical protein